MLKNHYNDFREIFRTAPSSETETPVFYDDAIRLLVTPSYWLQQYCAGETDSTSRVSAPSSAKTYADQLLNFLNYLSRRKIKLENICYGVLRDYRDDMKNGVFSYSDGKLSHNTINARIDRACAFADWLYETGVLKQAATKYRVVSSRKSGIKSFSGDISSLRVNKLKLPVTNKPANLTWPTKKQLDLTCERLKERGLMKDHQEIAIKLGYKCGLRVEEVSTLETSEFRKIQPLGERKNLWRMQIIGKGSKTRNIDIPRTLADQMRAYDSTISRQALSKSFLVNPNAQNKLKTFEIEPIQKYFRNKFLPELRRVTGNPSLKASFHTLRHLFAGDSFLHRLGFERPLTVDDAKNLRARLGGIIGPSSGRTGIVIGPYETALKEVQDLMGHSLLKSTEQYAKWASELVRATLAEEH